MYNVYCIIYSKFLITFTMVITVWVELDGKCMYSDTTKDMHYAELYFS